MNNEKLLYELIKKNGGMYAIRDTDAAQKLGKSKFCIPLYKRKLKKAGYIETKVKIVDNKPITLYKIVKDYDGGIDVTW